MGWDLSRGELSVSTHRPWARAPARARRRWRAHEGLRAEHGARARAGCVAHPHEVAAREAPVRARAHARTGACADAHTRRAQRTRGAPSARALGRALGAQASRACAWGWRSRACARAPDARGVHRDGAMRASQTRATREHLRTLNEAAPPPARTERARRRQGSRAGVARGACASARRVGRMRAWGRSACACRTRTSTRTRY